jgi:hypothetical protein
LTPDTNPTEALDIAVEPCAECAATTRWERRDLTPTSEAWLGTCEICGSMQVLALGVPDLEIEDPLGFYLMGDASFKAPAARPAWQRFYALTAAAPFFLKWSFTAASCESCQARTTVETRIATPRWRRSLSLCLNCGATTVETTLNMNGARPTRLIGGQWAPPDPAVKTLRETIIDTHRQWVAYHEWRRRTTDED